MNQDDLNHEDDDIKSKSQRKRESHSLQAMGKALTELKDEQLTVLPIEPRLRDALIEYKRLKHREAKRRQMQFIGRLMREADEEQIEEALDHFNQKSRHHIQAEHHAERWRERLLTESAALQAFIDEYPVTDIQHLRQLLRQAQKEQKERKPPASARKLFRYVRSIIADS